MGGKVSIARNLKAGSGEGSALGSCLLGKCLIKPNPPQIIQETFAWFPTPWMNTEPDNYLTQSYWNNNLQAFPISLGQCVNEKRRSQRFVNISCFFPVDSFFFFNFPSQRKPFDRLFKALFYLVLRAMPACEKKWSALDAAVDLFAPRKCSPVVIFEKPSGTNWKSWWGRNHTGQPTKSRVSMKERVKNDRRNSGGTLRQN